MFCPTVEIPNNCYIESGLCTYTLPSTLKSRITQTILSNNGGSTNIWTSYGSEKIITIPSNGSININNAYIKSKYNLALKIKLHGRVGILLMEQEVIFILVDHHVF